MANEAQIKAVITAEDKASKTIQGVANNTSMSFFKMAGAVATGQAALQLAEKAASGLFDVFKSSIDTTMQLGLQTLQLTRNFGLTAESASGLIAVFERFGVDADGASRAFGIFQKRILDVSSGNKIALKSTALLGVQLKDVNGNLRPMDQILFDVADKFKNGLVPSSERAGTAMALFGRSGQQLIPVLLQGKQGIIDLLKEADREGVVLSGANLKSIQDNLKAHRNLEEAMKGAKNQIGLALIPVITDVIRKVMDWINANGGIKVIMQRDVIPIIKEVIAWIERNRQSVINIIGFIKGLATAFTDAYRVIANAAWLITVAIFGVVKFFKNVPGWISTALKTVANIITAPFRIAFNAIIDLWDRGIGKMFHGQKINVGPAHFSLPDLNIPKLADGGIVNRPTIAMIGESGPEAVVPLNKSNSMQTVNISINAGAYMGSQQDARRYAQMIINAMGDIASSKNKSVNQLLGIA